MSLKRMLGLASMLLMLSLLCVGCSTDNPVSPPLADSEPLADDETSPDKSMMCHVYGNVDYLDGSDAEGVQVKIYLYTPYPPASWYEVATVTTGAYGSFSHDLYLYSGCKVKCASLGDVEERQWPGGAYMYFSLTQKRGVRTPYDPHSEP